MDEQAFPPGAAMVECCDHTTVVHVDLTPLAAVLVFIAAMTLILFARIPSVPKEQSGSTE